LGPKPISVYLSSSAQIEAQKKEGKKHEFIAQTQIHDHVFGKKFGAVIRTVDIPLELVN